MYSISYSGCNSGSSETGYTSVEVFWCLNTNIIYKDNMDLHVNTIVLSYFGYIHCMSLKYGYIVETDMFLIESLLIWEKYVLCCLVLLLLLLLLIIKKRGRQCNAEREWYTPYQSEDHSSTIPTYRQKEEKGKNSRRLYSNDRAA